MKKYFKLSSVLFIVLISLSSFTTETNSPTNDPSFKPMADTAAFHAKLNEMSKKLTSLESDFVQEKNLSILSEVISSKGHFYFKKPGTLKWEYNNPFTYIIVINNGKISIKDDGKINKIDMSANKMFQEINTKILDMLQGSILNNTTDFKFKFFENEKFYLIDATPISKGMKDYFKNINIYFDKKDLSVSKLKMMELSGDYTDIIFSNKKQNQGIADEVFNIK